jgi:predicted RNA-binding protein YlxR (DUF448 family)
VRIVAGPDGAVRVDTTGRAPGRGAYVCSNVGCLEQAIRLRRIGAALRTPGAKAQFEALMEEFATWQS